MISTVPLLLDSADISRGISIAVAGVVIVFVALILITLFIASLPRILQWLAVIWPEVEDHHDRRGASEGELPDDEAIIAGIGFVLHTEFQKQLRGDSAAKS